MYGPIIEGKLVRLRPPRSEDAVVMVTWFEDMEVTRFLLLRHPPSMEMEKEWLDRMARNPDDVVWVIEHKGQPVGTTALHMIDWKNGFATTGTVIGDKAVWGKGLGRELMQLRARYSFTQLPLRKLKSGYISTGTWPAPKPRRRPATARLAGFGLTCSSTAGGATTS